MDDFLAKMEQRLADSVGLKSSLEEKKIQLQTLKVWGCDVVIVKVVLVCLFIHLANDFLSWQRT